MILITAYSYMYLHLKMHTNIKPYLANITIYKQTCQVEFNICMDFYMQAHVYAVIRIMYH